jgi:polar amino acid transport system substrate-binding protein
MEGGTMRKGFAALTIAVLVFAACGEDEPEPQANGTEPQADACDPLPLKTEGTLTVAAEHPYYVPFLIGEQANPTGFEADLINGIAERLEIGEVTWVNIAFDQLYAPGPKEWDVGVSEITITPERDEVVDFSEPYFQANQGLLVRANSEFAGATTIEDLADARFGAEAGTTGLLVIEEQIQPSQEISQFDTTDIAAQALAAGTIDVQVIDVPIAIGIRDTSDVELVVIGEIITDEEYGLAMEEGNPLKPCVDAAIREMKDDGSLEESQVEWFPGSTPLLEFEV